MGFIVDFVVDLDMLDVLSKKKLWNEVRCEKGVLSRHIPGKEVKFTMHVSRSHLDLDLSPHSLAYSPQHRGVKLEALLKGK